MSHSVWPGNSSHNTFLNKKRQEGDIPIDNRYHYSKYTKYDKYTTHTRYNNPGYIHSKPPIGNNYYNSRYHGNNFNHFQKSYRRDFKKPYKKYSLPNPNENIRNLSNCDMPPSPPTLSQKNSEDTTPKRIESNNSINVNIRNISKFVKKRLNLEEKLEEAKNEEEEELPFFKFSELSEKKQNFESFNRNSIELEENPLENFEFYPKSLFEKGKNKVTKVSNVSNDNIYLNNFKNIIQLKSCYLLAKIPNWRLVTNFVPVSELKQEKFENFNLLDEMNDGDWGNVQKKPALVFFEKYEEIVDKFLEQNKKNKKQVETTLYNVKFIIAQYHNDIFKIKNKINQTRLKINYLSIKQENARIAIEQKLAK